MLEAFEVLEPARGATTRCAFDLHLGFTQFTTTTTEGKRIAELCSIKSVLPDQSKNQGGRNRAKQRRESNRLNIRVASLPAD
jgi:hypothetical protein